MIISLTGFMGVGKSTIASALSRHLYCKHMDLDKYIESMHGGVSIKTIFSELGEEQFRKSEENALQKLLTENTEKVLVLSLGGGALISSSNRELIKHNTQCIYLRASLDTLTSRLISSYKERPLITPEKGTISIDSIKKLFLEREPGYLYCSSFTIDVDNLPQKEILKKIMSRL
jgi:shikimate kinase